MSEKQNAAVNGPATASATGTGVYRPASAGQEEPVSVAIVEALAEAKGVTPLELDEPLYEVVDPEAVDSLFTRSGELDHGRLVFTVSGYEVTVTADHDVYVHER